MLALVSKSLKQQQMSNLNRPKNLDEIMRQNNRIMLSQKII